MMAALVAGVPNRARHGLAQFIFIDDLAGALHRRQQGGLRIPQRGFGFLGHHQDFNGRRMFSRSHGRQCLIILILSSSSCASAP